MNKGRLLTTVTIAILISVGFGIVTKTFILNQPSKSPKEIVRKYIDNINDNNRESNKELVTDNFIKKGKESNNEEAQEDSGLVTTLKEERIDGDKASVVHEADAGIVKLNVEFRLKKEGSWLKGFSWRIDDVITPDFDGTDEEETSNESTNWVDSKIKSEIQLATIRYSILETKESKELPSIYDFDSDVLKASDGNKFVVVKFKVINTTKAAISISSSDLFTLIDSEQTEYKEYSKGFSSYFENTLIYEELNPNIAFTGYTIFEVPNSLTSYGVASCKKDTYDCYLVNLR